MSFKHKKRSIFRILETPLALQDSSELEKFNELKIPQVQLL